MHAKHQTWPGRLLFAAKWAGVFASLLVLGGTIANMCSLSAVRGTSHWGSTQGVYEGTIYIPRVGHRLMRPATFADDYNPSTWRFGTDSPPSMGQAGIDNGVLMIPTWAASLAIIAPTILLWRLDYRRCLPGACKACAYPLSGLPPQSPCPECGQPRTPSP